MPIAVPPRRPGHSPTPPATVRLRRLAGRLHGHVRSERGSVAVEYVGLTAVVAGIATTIAVGFSDSGVGDWIVTALAERLAEALDLEPPA